ncbi:hypothetical protein WJX84_011269 [Apatococcus fuscideae]|uniref:RING-type domain-containing protein n=1 Tax=Apatococcus fuscideae TaxID=2026836 RepID=A0AAW1TBR3_9CHLO
MRSTPTSESRTRPGAKRSLLQNSCWPITSQLGALATLPRLWVDRAIGRDFYPFIQARKAGQGKAPRWGVVRHLLEVKAVCQKIRKQSAQYSVLGQQSAFMFMGQFDGELQLPSSSASHPANTAPPASTSARHGCSALAAVESPKSKEHPAERELEFEVFQRLVDVLEASPSGPAWSKVVESRLGKLEKQEGQFDAALWAEAQLRGCVSRCLPDDELAEEHFKLLVRMVEASQRRLSLKSPAYEQSRKASSATHLPAYQATCQDRMLQPSEEQLVKRQLKLEGKVYRIRQQPDNASHDSDSEEDLSRQSIEERVRIAIHRHVLHRSSRNWHPRVPIPRDASGEVVGVCTSLILLNPCTDEASRVSLTRQACKERAEAYILSSPTASVTVETFVEEGRMLPFHKVDCFRLVDLRIVRHGLQDFALAAIVDIMDSVDRADRRASDTNSTATAGGQFARPKPMGLHRRLASQGMAPSPARPVPKGRALREAPAAPNIESLLAEIFQNNQAANTPAEASMKREAAVASSASSENAIDLPEAAQLMASMAAAMATIGQASAALTASIHQAASWLGQRRAQAANPAQQDQVRERMRTSKAALLKLRPIEAMVAEAVKNVQPDAAEDEECSPQDDAIQPGPLLFTRQDEKSAAKAAKKAAKKQRKRHQQPPDGELRPENFELVVDALAALHSGSALPAAGHIGGTNTSAFAKLRALDDAQQQGLLLAAEGQLVKQHVELHRVMASIWGPDAQTACSHASDELLEADQMLSEMDAAVDTVIQASVALSSSIHRATRWLGHSTAQSVNPAKLQQVRERMRKSKVTLQKLSSAAAEGGCSMQQTGWQEDDNVCVICLEYPPGVTFHPCGHTIACTTCAKLVANARQPCPLCRSPVTPL